MRETLFLCFFREKQELKTFIRFLFLSVLILFSNGCHRSEDRKTLVVGYLGKKAITVKNLEDTARFMGLGPVSRHRPLTEWTLSERNAVLRETVQDIFLEEEGKKRGIIIRPNEIMDYLNNHFLQPDKSLETFARKALFLQKTAKALAPLPDISVSTERSFYKNHQNLFRVSRQAIVDHIVVAKQEEAESIRDALLKGSSFGKLAKLESLGMEASSGGRMKPYPQGTMPPPFDTVFTMKPGEISPVLSSSYGYHLFRLEKFIPKHTLPFSMEKNWIKKKLTREKRQKVLQGWLAQKLQKSPFHRAPTFKGIFSPFPVTISRSQTF
ncbi:putative foldase protein PrsA [Leptospirillum ferriphilum]|jgi:peptidyl-prolyl cis-trans isomerase C|uniref:peptidylprolyl isomerase n=3 Tax=Leptospirillum TaxID=179 RepID=A0A094WB42_9BACT|nr:MAG: Putative peptidyl-prolyl cis-trans isomerase [Leptospirillum sp. Group II '5-way CG']KGA94758.1 putative foldase protein PrsA [Leptospirillum ferriphilum]